MPKQVMKKSSVPTASRRFGEVLIDSIEEALKAKGFGKIDTQGNQPVLPDERIFNIGLDAKRSNVFVFAFHDKDNDSVRVLLSSPRSDFQSPAMGRNEIYSKKEFKSGEAEKIAAQVADKAAKEALAKHPNERRMQVHVHAGKDFDGGQFFDDGVSNIVDVVRRAMLHHADVLVYTPHNSYHPERFRLLNAVCRAVGMTAVLGLELTVPLTEKRVNGPHHVLMIGDEKAAVEIGRKILSKREGFKMPSYFRAEDGQMLLDTIYKILDPLRNAGRVALGAAHPFNYNSEMLPIKAVGLFSAVDMKQISLQAAQHIANSLDFMEVWNRSISPDQMPIDDPALRNWISGYALAYGFGEPSQANANTFNRALGEHLRESFKVQMIFGSDDHCTAPLDSKYLVGGDYLGAGFSHFTSEKRLSAKEIVSLVASKQLGLDAFIYKEIQDGRLQVAQNRVSMPVNLEWVVSKLKAKHLADYIRVLAADAWGFVGTGEFDMIGNMDK